MLVVLDKRDGEFSDQYTELMGQLADGRYLVSVRGINDAKTERDFQEQYFAMVDAVRDYTGDSRYIIHERFKKHRKVETTTNFSLQDWVDFIDAFKWKQFKDLDLIL